MNTLLRFTEANGMKNGKIESVPASELTTFLAKFAWMHGGKTEKKNWTGNSFQFSAQYKLTAILRRYIHLTYPRTMGSKNSEKSLQRSEIHLSWHEHGKGNKPQAAQAFDEDKEDALFFNFEFGDPNPVALQRTVWWFLYKTSVSEQENINEAIRYCLLPLRFLQVQTKHRIHQQVHIPNISW